MAEIVKATTAGHFALFQELVDELMAWDSAMTAQIGLDVDAMLDFFYEDEAGGLLGEVLLAIHEGGVAGCGALKHLSSGVAELSRLYVRPVYRGKGLGKTVLEAILAIAREGGHKKVCLETAVFMTDAHALYRSVGFQLTEPFREVPDDLKDGEVFMELILVEPSI